MLIKVNTHDHRPAHVHAFTPSGEVIISSPRMGRRHCVRRNPALRDPMWARRSTSSMKISAHAAVHGESIMASKLPTDAEMKAANEQYRATERGYAKTIRYRPGPDAFELELRSGVTLVIPRGLIVEFEHATASDLRAVTLTPSGSTITCEPLDVDISVPGIVRELTEAASWLARAGSRKTPEKAAAARANGAKGGRPRAAQAARRQGP
jgi:hypothetical protein